MTPYFLRNLVPKREKVERTRPLWKALKSLTWSQWGLFISGSVGSLTIPRAADNLTLSFYLGPLRWLAWTCDAIDFFCVSLTVVNLQQQFGRSTHDIVSHNSRTTHHISLSFPRGSDDVHHYHFVVPSRRRCKHLSIFLLSSMYAPYPPS